MRLKRIAVNQSTRRARLYFGDTDISVDLPAEWEGWTRQQRIAWGKQWLGDHLLTNTYRVVEQTVYPDPATIDQAKDDFENLPGWATRTPAEAEAWIETNVTDLTSAKTVLKAMAKAILYLRDVGIER